MEKLNIIKKILINIINMSKKAKIISIAILILLIIIVVLIAVLINIPKKQKYVLYNGENLDESKYPGYKELIDELKEKHPNWTFTLFYTRLDFNEVIENEGHSDNRTNPLNLIPDNEDMPEDWICEVDKDKTFDNGTWLCASDIAIKHQMDPRNIINEENIFQFKELNYVEGAYTVEGINSITEGSFLEGNSIAETLIEAGKNANVDPYFIASRLIQEQGREGTTLSKGYEYDGIIVYNPFNINASGNSSEEIINNAAKYAKEYGWDTLEKALLGGVEFVKEGYINNGQNTLYLQKFDVVDKDGELYTNQYMQNLFAPESEASNMREIYETSNSVDESLNFIIPLYENIENEENLILGSDNMNNQSEEMKINLIVNNKTFSATLENNETTKELISMFPMTLNMSDLNSNEKYNYLNSTLTTNSSRPNRINAGDIKLYGNNCLVVFYDSFNSSYSYTNLGKIDNVDEFVSELGSGSVTITFELAN